MAEGFCVDPGALADALDEMDDFQRTAASLFEEIESTVQALQITWTGAAAEGHAEAHRCWTQGAAVSAFTPGGAAPAKSGASAAALSSLAALVLAVAAAAAAAF